MRGFYFSRPWRDLSSMNRPHPALRAGLHSAAPAGASHHELRPFFDSYPALNHPSEPKAGSPGAPVTRWANPPVALTGWS